MTTTLSTTDGKSTDVEIVYEEVSLQSKLRQELNMLEILRETQEPIPANYSAFKERVGRLKYSFCPEVVDNVWKKLKEVMALEKEGKLRCNFNRRSLCGRDNCVCGKELPVVEVTSSESEPDDQKRNKTRHKSSILDGSTVESTGQHESTTESLNCSNNKSYNDSEIYNKLCRESVTDIEEEMKVHKKKSKRSGKEGVSESDCNVESHSEHNKSKSKIESYTYEDVINSTSEFYCSTETVKSRKEQIKEKSRNNEIVNNIEINTDTDILYSRKKKKKLKECVTEYTDNEGNMYNREQQERKTSKKEKQKDTDEVTSTDTFDCVSNITQEDANSTASNGKKRNKHKIKTESITGNFCNEVDSEIMSESTKRKKNADDNSISNVRINDDSKTKRKEYDGTNGYNKNKQKKRSWSNSMSDITKHMCELVENDIKTEEDNFDEMSKKTGSRHKKQGPSVYNSNGYSENGRERSVIIDAHIEIVRSSKNEKQRDDSYDTVSLKGDNNTSIRKKRKISDDEKYDRNSGISKSELKKFIKLQNKEKRKEKEKIVKHEWQLIHDRIVELLAPKFFPWEM